jgi:hypothetical protein
MAKHVRGHCHGFLLFAGDASLWRLTIRRAYSVRRTMSSVTMRISGCGCSGAS